MLLLLPVEAFLSFCCGYFCRGSCVAFCFELLLLSIDVSVCVEE